MRPVRPPVPITITSRISRPAPVAAPTAEETQSNPLLVDDSAPPLDVGLRVGE
jgi:hypothetical protein